MMNRLLSLFILVSLSFIVLSCDEDDLLPERPESATYQVTFNATWSSSSHPVEFPTGAHFSGLIGASHSEENILFEEGKIASSGIMRMAETGSKSILRNEIQSLIENNEAGNLVDGPGVASSPGVATTEVEVTSEHSLITVTTMIAPSPDWFVAISNVELYQNGAWVNELSINAGTYDAGSDSGSTFTSPNQKTDPFIPVSMITETPLAVDGNVEPLGTFTIQRVN